MDLDSLQDLAERNFSDPVIWLRLGEALAQVAVREGASKSDRAAAVAALMHAASIATASEILTRLASLLTHLGDLDGALQILLRVPDKNNELAGPCYEALARRLLEMERAPDAVTLLLQAEPLIARLPALALLRATAESVVGEIGAALADLDVALRVRPDLVDALVLRARLLSRTERREECVAAWRTVVRMQPDQPENVVALAQAFTAMGLREEAMGALAAASQQHPNSAEVWMSLAQAVSGAQRWDLAERALRRVLMLEPQGARAYFELGVLFEQQSRLEESVNMYREALQRETDVRTLLRVAMVLQRTGRIPEAIEAWMKAAALRPEDPSARMEIARAMTPAGTTMPPHTDFAGSLARFPIWEVLEILANRRSTGRLELASGGVNAEIALRGGSLVRVHFIGEDDDMARELLARRVDPAGLQSALEMRAHIAVERLVDWVDGTFTFHQEEVARTGSDVDLDLRYLLLDILRRRDEVGRG